MKNRSYYLIVVCLMFTTILFSQEYQKFKGVSFNGDLNSFTTQLENKGFEIKEKGENYNFLKGEFISKTCKVLVLGSKKTNVVWKVVVFLPDEIAWRDLKSEYFEIKEIYQNKYGKGKSYEFFSEPYYDGDGYELQALSVKKCTYVTYFETLLGYITIEIDTDGCVKIAYEDVNNVEINRKEKSDIINDDI